MEYPFKLPHTIENIYGEVLIFQALEDDEGEKKMLLLNRVKPGAGPPFHVHFRQEESLQVIKGTMGYQFEGEEEQYLREGERVIFPRGSMHRFWNAGNSILECSGWVKPANSLDFFLTGIYESMNKAGKATGDPFDTAFLLTKYKSEYALKDIPSFVLQIIFPVTVLFGKILGKYKHFRNAPKPIK